VVEQRNKIGALALSARKNKSQKKNHASCSSARKKNHHKKIVGNLTPSSVSLHGSVSLGTKFSKGAT
jgi:hypothetical protein